MRNLIVTTLLTSLLSFASYSASFPETISYEEMDVLAKGSSIEFEGQKLKAVSVKAIRDYAPGYLKRTARIAAYKAGAAEAPVANRVGEPEENAQFNLQTYLYKAAANMGVTFQFTLYSIDDTRPAGDDTILNTIEERDRVETIRYAHGDDHPEVLIYDRKTNLVSQQDEIKASIEKLKKRANQLKIAKETAVVGRDLIAFQYLRLLSSQVNAEILLSQQKLDFLEKKAFKMMDEATPEREVDGRGYPVFDANELKALSVDAFDRSFYTKRIDDEMTTLLKDHADAPERAKKYDLAKM